MLIPITITDIAKAAGVSTTTVSYVLNNIPKVSPNTRQKILRIIDELKYRPNRTARALAGSRSNSIGLVIPNITTSFYINIVSAIEDEAVRNGLALNICMSRADGQLEKRAVDILRVSSVDGIILMTFHLSDEYIVNLKNDGNLLVSIGGHIRDKGINRIYVDNYDIGYKATSALLDMGHRKIAILCGLDDSFDSNERLRGYLGAFSEYKVPFSADLIKQGRFDRQSGYEIMRELLIQPQRPTAVFAANDLMAIGVIEACNEARIPIPDELSVIGVDDIETASLINPKLSTIRQPMRELGELAVKKLLHLINSESPTESEICLETRLILRDSTAAPRDLSL